MNQDLDEQKGKKTDISKALDMDNTRPKYYMLSEFPYPSGSGLHVGHAFTMTGADVQARFMRMSGYNVLFPMGYDAFGLPTENYAIKMGTSPQQATKENTETFRRQMDQLGFSFDWNREVNTTDPLYYRWTQWIFVKLFEHGLAEKQEKPINWCPACKIGLANEEVIDDKCERCGTVVGEKNLSQWVLKITKYADRLIEGLNHTNFIDKVKAAQINWIGKKVGAKVFFDLGHEIENIKKIEVFTTRPDTLEGVTFLAVAPEHELVKEIIKSGNDVNGEIAQYVEKSKNKDQFEREDVAREKTGVFAGVFVQHPINKTLLPVWIADYVTMSYGTGAIMGVPSHDERDREFAKKFGLPVNEVYVPDDTMLSKIIELGIGDSHTTYHLNDWIFSRQHYWGEPIPMIWCDKDGWVSVPEENLPVVLPEVEAYQPTDTGESPLAAMTDWLKVKCPTCGEDARRETDTMPNWAGSDWYFLRYCDPQNDTKLAEMDKMSYWLPVDLYVGGDEHTTLHLLYSRFIYQFLWDIGAVPKEYPEPYKKRVSHGVILGPDGNRMSKSKGNVITPDTVVKEHGADVTRAYMMFMGPFDATMAWNDRALMGIKRFMTKFATFVLSDETTGETDKETKSQLHSLIKFVSNEIKNLKYNTAIAKIMGTTGDWMRDGTKLNLDDKKVLILLMAPIAPFITEELWKKLGGQNSVHEQNWPQYVEEYIQSGEIKIAIQVNGKLRGVLTVTGDITEEEVDKQAVKLAEKYLHDKKIIRKIYVANKMMSYVCDEI